jgi:glutamate racemase
MAAVFTKHIGVFDSGVGGLSVLKALQSRRSKMRYTYFADSLHAPYGSLDSNTLLTYSERIVSFLESQGADLIVVACNTLTTELIGELRSRFKLPFVGIEPAVKPAAAQSLNKCIGVLATERTLKSAGYRSTCQLYAADVTLVERVGAGLVEAIEHLPWTSKELRERIKYFTDEFRLHNIDTLVLGCTHYPLVESLFCELLGESVKVLSTAEAVAKRVEQLTPNTEGSQSELRLYTSGSAEHLAQLVERLSFTQLKSVSRLEL